MASEPDQDGTAVHYRTCPLCEATCGLEITMKGDSVQRIRGDRDDVFSHGFICPKGSTLKQLHEDPDRLRAPLVKRDGQHVEVTWDEAFATVERLLSPVIEANGRDAVAIYLGNPNVHNLANTLYARPLIMAMATTNIYSASTVDQMPKHVSSGLMFGDPLTIAVPDLDRTDYALLLGANPWASNGSLATAPDFPGRLEAIQTRGGRFVVVDPRRTRTAEAADEHLTIRPGTDAHWLCALIQVLLADGPGAEPSGEAGPERPAAGGGKSGEQGPDVRSSRRTSLADLGRLAPITDGLEALADLVAPFTPEVVAPVCGIPAETTRRIAHELAGAERAVVYGRIGTQTVAFGTIAAWAVDVVNALTGNLDEPGGAMFPYPAHAPPHSGTPGGRGFSIGRHRSRVSGHPEVRRELPVAALAEEIETPGQGQIRALLTVAGNPVLSCPDTGRLDAALGTLDAMISVDPYLNETTRHADVVLPPPSPLAKSHYDLAFYALSVRNIANWSAPITEPTGPLESEILARLSLIFSGQPADADPAVVDDLLIGALVSRATREGGPLEGRDPADLAAQLTGDSPADRALDAMLRTGPYGDLFGAVPDGLSLTKLQEHPHGIDLGPLTPQLPAALRTPNGRIDLVPALIAEDLSRLAEHLAEATAAAASTPDQLVLIGRRHLRSNNSWMHNLEVLVKGKERCTLQVHPADAARLGLDDGKPARIASRVGQVEAPVEVTDEVMAGVVSLPHGWGHAMPGARLQVAERHAGVNTNLLTDGAQLDPLSGNAVLNGIPVTVAPA